VTNTRPYILAPLCSLPSRCLGEPSHAWAPRRRAAVDELGGSRAIDWRLSQHPFYRIGSVVPPLCSPVRRASCRLARQPETTDQNATRPFVDARRCLPAPRLTGSEPRRQTDHDAAGADAEIDVPPPLAFRLSRKSRPMRHSRNIEPPFCVACWGCQRGGILRTQARAKWRPQRRRVLGCLDRGSH
jgi:hypothetical protein